MSFDISFLGSSGGCLDGTTCAVLVKPHTTSYGDIVSGRCPSDVVCVDAGSGLNLLGHIIAHEMRHGAPFLLSLELYNDLLPLHRYFRAPIATPFSELDSAESPLQHSLTVFRAVSAYLVSHPHLDHIAALAINLPAFSNNNTRHVYGSVTTVNALQKHVFNGLIWPNMPLFGVVKLHQRAFWNRFDVAEGRLTVEMFDISHGTFTEMSEREVLGKEMQREKDGLNDGEHEGVVGSERELLANRSDAPTEEGNSDQPHRPLHSRFTQPITSQPNSLATHYISSAFLITDSSTQASLLVFGDFESDTMSQLTKNRTIWQRIAPLITTGHLRGIVLECSSTGDCDPHQLHGHLMPSHLISELESLQAECLALDNSSTAPLTGLHVVVTHVKDMGSCDPRRRILAELDALSAAVNLGVQFSMAISGISIVL